jgi:predicted DNA-binding protein
LIPGTSSRIHLKENNAATLLRLPPELVERLNSIAAISRQS